MLCLLVGVIASGALAADVKVAETPNLAKLLLTPSQVGPGYRLVQRPDGHGVKGIVTLDMCGYRFASEKLRTNRLQVNYVHPGTSVTLSNEIVTYQPGGATQALEEVAYAASHCPTAPLKSMDKAVSAVSFKVSPVPVIEPAPCRFCCLRDHDLAHLSGQADQAKRHRRLSDPRQRVVRRVRLWRHARSPDTGYARLRRAERQESQADRARPCQHRLSEGALR